MHIQKISSHERAPKKGNLPGWAVIPIILVIALLTLPAATAGCFTRHLWSMMTLATVLSWLFVTGGLLSSFYYRLPSGPAIVVLAGTVYLAALGFTKWRGKR